jgi:hypothetical protein
MLRHQLQQGEEELHALRRAELSQASEKSKQAAIARFHEGGELCRLLHPQSYQSTFTPTLRSHVPSRIEVTGGSPSIQEMMVVLAGITDLEFRVLQEVESIVVDGIRPADLLACLQAAARPPRKMRILSGRQRLAHTATDRLSAWEYSLASEATAKQGVFSRCLGKDVTPVTAIDGDSSCMVTWCLQCSATTSLLVRVSEYDSLPLQMEHFSRIPADSGETLAGAISREDFEYFL